MTAHEPHDESAGALEEKWDSEDEGATPAITRRGYLASAATAATGTVGLAGCTDTATATGTLATEVTDQPGDIGDFESCVVTIQGIWVEPGEVSADETDTDGDGVDEMDEGDVGESDERAYHEFDEPQEADLVDLQGENTRLVDERDLEAGTYQFLQLDVTDVTAEFEGGDAADVGTPGDAPLQFDQPFEVREDQTTTFVGDFTPVRRGQTGQYLLQPVARGTSVTYEEAE